MPDDGAAASQRNAMMPFCRQTRSRLNSFLKWVSIIDAESALLEGFLVRKEGAQRSRSVREPV